jgi:hypothetical protein
MLRCRDLGHQTWGVWMSIIRHVMSCLILSKNAEVGFPGDLDISWYFKLGVWR